MLNFFKKKRKQPQFIAFSTNELAVTFTEEKDIIKDFREQKEPVKLLPLLLTKIRFPKIDIDKKIKSLKERKKLFEQATGYEAEEENLALQMLQARKKYEKTAHLFCWPVTTHKRINFLTEMYQLEHNFVDRYVKKLPSKALTEMVAFSKVFKKVCRGTPEFSLIAPSKDFKSEDPILLAKSPFGDYFYVLCAWDKEVSIVDELFVQEDT